MSAAEQLYKAALNYAADAEYFSSVTKLRVFMKFLIVYVLCQHAVCAINALLLKELQTVQFHCSSMDLNLRKC